LLNNIKTIPTTLKLPSVIQDIKEFSDEHNPLSKAASAEAASKLIINKDRLFQRRVIPKIE